MESRVGRIMRRLRVELARFVGRRETPELRIEMVEVIRAFEARLEREGEFGRW